MTTKKQKMPEKESGDTTKKTEQPEIKVEDDRKTLKEVSDSMSGKLTVKESEDMKRIMRERLGDISMGESSFDVDQYIGVRTVIDMAHIESYEKFEGDVIKAETEVLGTYERDGEEREVRGSVLFPIYYDGGEIKYRPKGKLAKFLRKHSLSSPGDLIGCSVLTTVRSTDTGDFVGFA